VWVARKWHSAERQDLKCNIVLRSFAQQSFPSRQSPHHTGSLLPHVLDSLLERRVVGTETGQSGEGVGGTEIGEVGFHRDCNRMLHREIIWHLDYYCFSFNTLRMAAWSLI